ncbi:MAG: cell division protein ZipA C-terminal FtsZ-binding domain-containing protein, partial [Pseudohongiella sp.]|nr:cell division protein ZipA C-terminal FtsZ-binding domain-containing protein [Pseudohongiella sp.]
DLFEDEDQQRRREALEQEQESAPKRFMSWAGAALGKLTAGVASNKARAKEEKAAAYKAANQKAQQLDRQRQEAVNRDDGDFYSDDPLSDPLTDPLADYAVDRAQAPRAAKDEYQEEFQEGYQEGYQEEHRQEESRQETQRQAHAGEYQDYNDELLDEYQPADTEQYDHRYEPPLTEQEKKVAKYGESPYAGHRFGVDSVPADSIAAIPAAAPASSSPYSDSRPSAASPTKPESNRSAAASRAATTASARSLRENQLSLDMPQEEDDRDPGYSQVLVINVMARPKSSIQGDELLPLLLGAGLRFGEMSIFHRHADRKGGPVLFSVANALNPGTFDLNRISDFSTQGVCFFMTLPNVANNMLAFEQMLAT